MMVSLVGELLNPPLLRFNYASISAKDDDARRGLSRYGPYDYQQLNKDRLSAVVVFPHQNIREKDILIQGLQKGCSRFQGFRGLFRLPLVIEDAFPFDKQRAGEVERVIRGIVRRNTVDLVLLVGSSEGPYQTAKRELLGNGIPSQYVTVGKLGDSRQAPWVIENVALASYAKIGGTPWVIASDDSRRELVIGVSRAQARDRRFVVGFVTLFSSEGDFLLLNSSAPVFGWDQDEYVEGLSRIVVEAYNEYCEDHNPPDSLVLHFCKRPGRFREVEAVRQAFDWLSTTIPYALVHLNDDSAYRLFDAGHRTYIPQAGLKVDVGPRNALLLLDGLVKDKRNRRGMPAVLDVSMDKRSTMPTEEFPRLVRQIFGFGRVNWRGFNAYAVPVTLNYSYLIARIIIEIGAEGWNEVICSGKLRDKAWFL